MRPGDTCGASVARSLRRRVSSAGSVLGVLALVSVVMAPSAAADSDIQAKQWYLDAMSADDLWDVSTGEGIKVAVIDSGVNPSTASLKGQVLPGVDLTGEDGDEADDYDGHGTSMAELIAGTGEGGGLKGLAPDAKIIPLRVPLSTIPSDAAKTRIGATAKAIRVAADSDARIISMSFSGHSPNYGGEAAVRYAQSKGKLLFASVGNDGDRGNYFGWPAGFRGVVGVSAADADGKVGKFSEFGDYIDLAAPGLDVPTWCDESFRKYCAGQGTSQAAAIASAAAALVWSKHPNWTSNQVLRVLIDTAGRDWPKDEPSDYLGYGLVRPAPNLLKGRGNPGPADVDPITNKKTPGVGSSKEASPSASAPASSQPPKGSAGGGAAAAASSSKSTGSDGQLWLVLGSVAAAAVIGGTAFAMVRARRRA